jgi:hypothetical protein
MKYQQRGGGPPSVAGQQGQEAFTPVFLRRNTATFWGRWRELAERLN